MRNLETLSRAQFAWLTPFGRRARALRLPKYLTAAILILLASFGNSAAIAQTATTAAFPVVEPIDENGVDVTTGTYVWTTPTIAVGDEKSGLSETREIRGKSYLDSAIGLILPASYPNGFARVVSFGDIREKFDSTNGVTFTPETPRGQTLTFNSSTFTYTYTDPDGLTLVFKDGGNAFGNAKYPAVTQATFPDGKVLTFYYSTTGTSGGGTGRRLQSVVSNTGYQIKFDYQRAGTITSVGDIPLWSQVLDVEVLNNVADPCDPTANICNNYPTKYPHFSVGTYNATASHYCDAIGACTYFTFDTYNGITGVQYPGSSSNNVVVTYTGPYGQVASVTKEGTTTTYSYTGNSTVATKGGATRTYTYDSLNGLITSFTDELGHQTTYEYDPQHRLTKVTYPELNYITYQYDARSNLITTTQVAKPGSGLANIVTSATYPSSCVGTPFCNKPLSTTDARGNVTDYTYDSTHAGVLSVTSPAPTSGDVRPQTRYTYQRLDVNGAPSGTGVFKTVGVSACRTTASCIGTADEARTTIAYGRNLLPVSTTQAAGDGSASETTTHAYDDLGDPISTDGPLAGTADTTVSFFNAARELTGSIRPDPDDGDYALYPAQRITYDTAGRPYLQEEGTVTAQTASALSSMTVRSSQVTGYDSNNRPVTVTSKGSDGAAYSLTQTGYNALGQVSCVATRMNPAAYGSFPATDACTLGAAGSYGPDRITSYHYDAVGRADSTTTGYATGDAAVEQASTYSANGKLATEQDALNNCTQYKYDGFDRLVETHFPSATVPAPACSLTSDYEQYGLDASGNVTTFRTRAGETLTQTYDNLNRLITKIVPERSGLNPTYTRDVYYGYDLFGDQTYARFDSAGGEGITFGYDALGRKLTETQAIDGTSRTITSGYDAANSRTTMNYPDGNTINSYRYSSGGFYYSALNASSPLIYPRLNAASELSGLWRYSTGGGGWNVATGFGYDPVHRLTTQTQDFAGSTYDSTTTLTLNPASQITSRTNSNDAYAWTGATNVTRPYTANGLNQYAAVNGVAQTYDANGNLTSDGSNSYYYDVENRLIAATVGGIYTTLRYDPLGRLYEVNGGATGITRFLNDDDDLVGEYNSSGTLLRRYVHGDGTDQPLVWFEGSTVADSARRYLYSDERGSVVAVTDSNGNVLNLDTYDEHGIPGSANQGRFQYTGQAWLPELGMYYYKARMYSPTLGRFMQTDPIGYGDGMNMYGYVHNDPMNRLDPTGLDGSGACPGPCIPPDVGQIAGRDMETENEIQEFGYRDWSPQVGQMARDSERSQELSEESSSLPEGPRSGDDRDYATKKKKAQGPKVPPTTKEWVEACAEYGSDSPECNAAREKYLKDVHDWAVTHPGPKPTGPVPDQHISPRGAVNAAACSIGIVGVAGTEGLTFVLTGGGVLVGCAEAAGF